MVLLAYASSAATAASSYAFTAASSYVFRADASTSAGLAPPASGNGNGEFGSTASSSPPSTCSSSSTSRRLSVRRTDKSGNTPRVRLPSSHHPHRPSSSSRSSARSASAAFSSTSSSSSSTASTAPSSPRQNDFGEGVNGEGRGEGEDMVDQVNQEEDLYEILGVKRKVKTEEIRRAFLARSRVIHPDKLPFYPPSTTAFQRLSYAYETLSKPSSRRLYDLGGGRGYDPGSPSTNPDLGDETLNGVLRSVINEFLNGDFEMIRVFVTALNEGNPSLNLGDEAVDNLEGAFRRVREALLAGGRYLRLIKFELIRLYEIQHSLRSLSYFDVYGRLRLTLALTRVTLEIPMVLDRAMRDDVPPPSTSSLSSSVPSAGIGLGRPKRGRKTSGRGGGGSESTSDSDDDEREDDGEEGSRDGQLERRGLLGTRTRGMLVITCKMLEKAERWAGSGVAA